jgi:hypothetical protein
MSAMARAERTELDLEQLTPETLAALDDWDMRSVVGADLRRRSANERVRTEVPAWISATLRGELFDRWYTALQQMLASVNGQLEVMANEHEEALAAPGVRINQENGRYHGARTGPLRFRAALLEAMPEAERLLEGRRMRVLERAIQAHRTATIGDESVSPSVADWALWALIDPKDQHQHETDARSTTRPGPGR